jgi:hypothetical protein
MASTLLMARKNEVEMLGVMNGIENWKNSTSRVTKNMLHPVTKHHLVEDLTA